MMNPCYECPKYREYGEWLDDVLISKTPVPEPVKTIEEDKPNIKIKKPAVKKKGGTTATIRAMQNGWMQTHG